MSLFDFRTEQSHTPNLQFPSPVEKIPAGFDLPPFPTQQHMDTTIAVAHAGSGDLPDTFTQMSLPGST